MYFIGVAIVSGCGLFICICNKVQRLLMQIIPFLVIDDLLRPPPQRFSFDLYYATNIYTLRLYTLRRGTSIQIPLGQLKTRIHQEQIVRHWAEDCLSASTQQRAVHGQ